jgi:hypothetical protein
MFPAEQYRVKAAEYAALLRNMSCSPNETSEFRNLEQTYTTLAENEEWMAINIDKTVRRRKNPDNRTDLDEDDEQVLRCVATAAIMQANAGPAQLRQELTGGADLSISSQTAVSTAVVADWL